MMVFFYIPITLGVNTISVNGRTTVSFASCHLDQAGVQALRDEAYKILCKISKGIHPDTGYEGKF